MRTCGSSVVRPCAALIRRRDTWLPQSTTDAPLCLPRARTDFETFGIRGRTREHASRENSEHQGARQVSTGYCGQALTWCTLFKLGACMRRTFYRRVRSSILPWKSFFVGLLCSTHSFSFLLNAFENLTQWRRNKRNTKTKIPEPLRPTTSFSPAMFSTRHVCEPLGGGVSPTRGSGIGRRQRLHSDEANL